MTVSTGGQKGFISLLAIFSLALILISIPITVGLVKQRQETREKAAYESPTPIAQVSPSPEAGGCECVQGGYWSGSDCPEWKLIQPCEVSSPSPSPSPRGVGESCQSTANCAPGLECAALPGGYFCVAPTCTNGGIRCSGNMVQTCQNGQWRDTQRCDAGCSNGVCLKACNSGENRCVGDVLETCYHDGSGWSGKSCEYGCANGVCILTPTPSPTCVCSGGFWSGTGCTAWQQGMPCQEVPSPSPAGPPPSQCDCAPGEECVAVPGGYQCLVPTCSSGETRCSGSVVQTCQNGQWRDIQRCDAGCSGGSCVRACNPGSTRCVGDEQQTCGSTGGGWSTRSCSSGCSSGQCLPPPSPSPLPAGCAGQGGSCDFKACCPGYACTGPHLTCATAMGGGCTSDSYCGTSCYGTSARACVDGQCKLVANDPECEVQVKYQGMVAQALFGAEMIGLGVVGVAILGPPAATVATTAYVTTQAAISTAPSWVQTAVGLALPAAELAGTTLAALECSLGNQEACMMGMIGGLAYTEQSMVGAIAQQQYLAEQAYWRGQYEEALEALASVGVPVENVSGSGYIYRQPRGESGWIVEDPLQFESWQDRLVALEHEFGHEIGRAATDYTPLTRSQVITEEYMNYSRTASSPYASTEMRSDAERIVNALDQILSWDLPLSTRESMAIQTVSSQTEGEWPLLFLP